MRVKQVLPPGDFGVWIIVYVELVTFGALFLGYAFSRRLEVELFNESQLLLDQRFGFVNTIILITSSYFVVKAVESIQLKDRDKANYITSRWLLGAMGLGSFFIINKIVEFMQKSEQGIDLSTNTFFMFYIMLTVFHFMHVLLGLIVLFNMQKKAKNGGYTLEDYRGLQTGAIYWHLVDLLWIVLFPLIYIMR
ncbi:cytochrome c oxidase subunit 3 family protein [Sulfurimonas aquatica]|uniref:Cytochrome c oxidase subunit 3 family protein n=1 Tax=Sulfurimonas aquatica TaxID=2672570 RepID=A0A975B2A5_9BACT|nr:cytochrome c oxidase subunit 3 family protein [Sulfurimonas aquatica]QSZ42795.1 cytochrome c oxidase subunit 3 family protein [Sulfurimonas aquatica]